MIANSAGPLPGNSTRRHPSLQTSESATPVRPGRAYNCQRRAVPGPQPGLGYPSPLRVPVRLRGTAHRRNHQPGSQGDSPGLRRRPTPCVLRSVAAGVPRRASARRNGACTLCEARRRDRRARGSRRRSRGVARERIRASLSVILIPFAAAVNSKAAADAGARRRRRRRRGRRRRGLCQGFESQRGRSSESVPSASESWASPIQAAAAAASLPATRRGFEFGF